MDLLYVISSYKLPEELVRLVRTLRSTGTTFFVHVDRRSPGDVHTTVRRGLAGLEDVHVLEPHDSPHASFGHVRTTLKGLAAADRLGVPFDYDPPHRPGLPNQAGGRADRSPRGSRRAVVHRPLPDQRWRDGGLDRFERWHFNFAGRRWRFPNRFAPVPLRRRMPGGLRPWGSSSYWCLSRSAVDYVQRFVRANPNYVRLFHTVDVSDELFFQTILLNSPLRGELIGDDLRHIVWEPSGVALLGPDRLDELAASQDIFARKFDTGRDPTVLDLVDQRLLGVGDSEWSSANGRG